MGMHIILRGRLVRRLHFLGPGDVIGEVDILFDNEEFVDRSCPRTLVYVDMLTLNREILLSITDEYPLAQKRLRRAFVRNVARRGFVNAAMNQRIASMRLTPTMSPSFAAVSTPNMT